MLEKLILVYLIHSIPTKSINAQSIGFIQERINTGEHNPTADSLAGNIVGPDANSVNPAQAIGNIDSMGFTGASNIPEPISANFGNHGVINNLTRSARGTLIGGFENHMLSIDGLSGNPVYARPFAIGSTEMANGGVSGANIGTPLSIGLAGPIDVMGSISQPIEEFLAPEITEKIRIPINPDTAGALTSGTIADGIFNAAIGTNNPVVPIDPAVIPGNPINAINVANGIANGYITTPILKELNQIGISNRLENSIGLGGVGNLRNPTGITTATMSKFPNLSVGNRRTQEMLTNILPASFPGRDLAVSKSILASLTGIDPTSLRTNARFRVKSQSPNPPTGLTIQADNLLMEGKLAITGKMPFLGAVTVDGVLADGGIGSVLYEYGNGNIGIVNETPVPATMGPVSTSFVTNMAFPNVITNYAPNKLGLRTTVL